MKNISLLSSMNEYTSQLKMKIIPLVKESLKGTNFIDYSYRKMVLSKLNGRGYLPNADNVIMSIEFNPKTCKWPVGECCGECNDCDYNPLKNLLDEYWEDGPFVITTQETVGTLLDVICLLANANKNALLREKYTESGTSHC